MHRSASATRVYDEHYKGSMSPGMEINRLPSYDPLSEAAKKEAGRVRLAENMVHLIPLIIILCAALLWFFSQTEIDLPNKDEPIIARIKNMTIDGYSNWNGTSMTMGMEDLDPINQIGVDEPARELDSKEP